MKWNDILTEASYANNIGFQEMAMFYQKANEAQIKTMEKIVKAKDWEGFKKLIQRVLGVKLQ